MTAPSLLPPDPFDPVVEIVRRGTVLFRVHEPGFPNGDSNDGTVFNPGFGRGTRFAFFGDPPVPVLYLAASPEAAVHETVLHSAEPGSFIPRAWWETKVLTAVLIERDLRVAAFHSDGLRRFGLYPADLTDTDARAYPRTRRWAEAAWKAGYDGVSYMSRHYNSSAAICLFGDRVPDGSLLAQPEHDQCRMFALPTDAEWLASVAAAIRVVTRP